jgi:hypothetical protein
LAADGDDLVPDATIPMSDKAVADHEVPLTDGVFESSPDIESPFCAVLGNPGIVPLPKSIV